MTLVEFFKKNPTLETDVGNFDFVKSIDQGGNANVLQFKREDHLFAIKFIPHDNDGKVRRFRDEFFAASQIPTHKNIVRCYHFDTRTINEQEMSLIVMKLYESSLHALGDVSALDPLRQDEKGWRLFMDLCMGLKHLHSHHIIHRDVKPQNVFYEESSNRFVLGDLGIAHFKDEIFAKEAETKPGERLANYKFSAPEQTDSRNKITPAADIYSLGQVMQWYFTGSTIRGLGRRSFATASRTDHASILDAVVARALQHDAKNRFQSIDDILTFIKDIETPKRDIWRQLYALDDVIRRVFPEISTTLAINDQARIREFLTTFQGSCDPNEFWYMMDDGGDGNFESLTELQNGRWLLNGITELANVELLLYRDNNYPYKNFFILLFGPDTPFAFSDRGGHQVSRESTQGWTTDQAVLVDDSFYLDPDETRNGYYRDEGGTVHVTSERFKDRTRHLVQSALLVVPNDTATAVMIDRQPSVDLIQSTVKKRQITDTDLRTYLTATRGQVSPEIRKSM
ncbi:protein kinase [Paraburkholderia sp. SIMBA_055]